MERGDAVEVRERLKLSTFRNFRWEKFRVYMENLEILKISWNMF